MYKSAAIGLGNIGMLYGPEPQRPHPSTHVAAYDASLGFRIVCEIDGDEGIDELINKMEESAK